MNYELAKKLKDAGFPQNEEFLYAQSDMKGRDFPSLPRHLVLEEPDMVDSIGIENCKKRAAYVYKIAYLTSEEGRNMTVYLPTLEELIEACGGRFHFLELGNKLTGEREVSDWWYVTAKVDKGEIVPICDGLNPESAVANLWLELNK